MQISAVDEAYAASQIHLEEYTRSLRCLQFIFCSHILGTPAVYTHFSLIADVLLFANLLLTRAQELAKLPLVHATPVDDCDDAC
jgi:hypothetical protein